jgi:universal stress protein A
MNTTDLPSSRPAPLAPRGGPGAGTHVVAAVAPDDNDDVLRVAWVRASTMGLNLVVCTVVADASEVTAAYAALTQRIAAQLPADAAPELDVRIGDKADEILTCASTHDTALIVLGSSSEREGLLARIFRPSVPTALLRGASCPILVARYSPPTGRILAATNLGDPSHPVLRAAAAEVQRSGGQVVAVHCVAPVPVMPVMDVPESLPVSSEDLASSAHAELENAVRSAGLDSPTLRVEMGSPAPTVLALAKELAVDLIIVGTHGRSGPARVLMGSVAEEILREAPCNVMAVRLDVPEEASA